MFAQFYYTLMRTTNTALKNSYKITSKNVRTNLCYTYVSTKIDYGFKYLQVKYY
jgi:hypothetical protein